MLDVFAVVFNSGTEERGGVTVAAHKFSGRCKGEIHEIVEDENLPVAIGTGANPNRRNGQRCGDLCRGFAGNAFKNQSSRACFGKRKGIGPKLARGFSSAGLHTIAAHAIHALRGEAEMADHGNFCIRESADEFDARAFDLDSFGSRLLDEPDGVGESLGDRAVIATEGHVSHDQRAMHGAAHGACVVQHLVNGDGKRIFVAEDDLGERIADKDEIDACLIDKARGGVIVGSERGDGLALTLHFTERGHGDFGEGIAGLREARAGREFGETHVFSSAAPNTQDATRTKKVYAGRARCEFGYRDGGSV